MCNVCWNKITPSCRQRERVDVCSEEHKTSPRHLTVDDHRVGHDTSHATTPEVKFKNKDKNHYRSTDKTVLSLFTDFFLYIFYTFFFGFCFSSFYPGGEKPVPFSERHVKGAYRMQSPEI